MSQIFSLDSPVMSFLNRMADLVWLNVLYIICCIPIFTIGAATSALYYVTMKMTVNEECYITKSFFKAFKDNFKQATIVWVAGMLVYFVFFVDFKILSVQEGTVMKVIFVTISVLAIVFTFMFIYIFPLLAKFENTIKNSIKNALLISIRHFPYTLLLIAGFVAPFFVLYFVTALLPALFLIVFSLIAYYSSFIYKKIFDIYIPQEEDAVAVSEESEDIQEITSQE